jgi:predicted nucleotidyltransferase/HEPN domain-containing protein
MKASIGFLSAKKKRQIEEVADLIRKEAEVEMVILFGSHARGDYVEDPVGNYFSDFDVLVLVKSPRLVEKHTLWSRIEQLAQRITAPTELSLLVHDIKDVNEQLEKGFYFFSDIKKEGVLLYESGRFHLADAKEHTAEERRAQAERWFEDWFTSAGHFFEDFEANLAKGRHKKAAFELHQATERYYHTALLVLTAYKPKTHNLDDLGKRAADLHPELRAVFPRETPEDDRLFKLLKRAYVDARYSSKFVVTAEELEKLGEHVRTLREKVERVCKEKIDAMGLGPRATD